MLFKGEGALKTWVGIFSIYFISRIMENGERQRKRSKNLLIKDKYHDSTMETKERIATVK